MELHPIEIKASQNITACDTTQDKILNIQIVSTNETISLIDPLTNIINRVHVDRIDTQGSSQQQGKSESIRYNPTNPINHLRFLPLNKATRLIISNSGLAVTSTTNKESSYAVGNIGFSSGVNYWEIICPINCKDIQIGIIKEGWNPVKPNQIDKLTEQFEFNTSTSRVVGIKLDLVKSQLKCWLNGNFQQQRVKSIAPGIWYPFIKLQNSSVILNPFAIDPENQYSFYDVRGANSLYGKLSAKNWVAFRVSEPADENDLKSKLEFDEGNLKVQEEIVSEDKRVFLYRFITDGIAERFCQLNRNLKFNTKKLTFLDRNQMETWSDSIQIAINTNTDINNVKLAPKAGQKPDEITNITEFLNKNYQQLTYFSQKIEKTQSEELKSKLIEIQNQLEKYIENEFQGNSSSNYSASLRQETQTESLKVSYIKKGDSLLIAKDNLLKIISRQNGQFLLKSNIFGNKPTKLDDIVSIYFTTLELSEIIKFTPFEHIIEQGDEQINLIQNFLNNIVNSLKVAENKHRDTLISIKMTFKEFKQIIDSFLSVILEQLKLAEETIEKLLESKEQAFRQLKTEVEEDYSQAFKDLPFPPEQESTEMQQTEKQTEETQKQEGEQQQIKNEEQSQEIQEQKNLITEKADNLQSENYITGSIEHIYKILSVLLRIDEELWAMSYQSNQDLRGLWSLKPSRTFSSWSRLGSFISWPSSFYDIKELAEAGLYNQSDIFYQVRHFLEPKRKLHSLVESRNNKSLWKLLLKQVPRNRMLEGLPNPNVPLYVTINSLPYSEHEGGAITEIHQGENSSYISTASEDGSICLWNSQLGLLKVAQINYRSYFEQPKSFEIIFEERKKEKIGGESLFEDELPYNVLYDKVDQIQQQNIEPDPVLMENLYKMGFPLDIVKYALIKCNNESIEKALDSLFKLQEEQKPAPGTRKRGVTILKSEWQCLTCTFLNINSKNNLCEICQTPAPISAYQTEEELVNVPEINEIGKTEEQKEEEAQLQRQIQIKQGIIQERESKLKKGVFKGHFLTDFKKSIISPLMIGVALSGVNDNQSTIILRRLSLNPSYLKRFINSNQLESGYFVSESQYWLKKADIKEFSSYLLENQRLAFECLIPIYNSETHVQQLIQTEENEIELNYKEILGIQTKQINDKIVELYITVKNNSTECPTLLVYQITDNYNEPYSNNKSINVELIDTQEIDQDYNLITINSKYIVLGNSKHPNITILKADTRELVNKYVVQGFTSEITKIQFIKENELSLIVDNKLQYFELSKNIQPENIAKEVDQALPRVEDLTFDDYLNLCGLLSSKKLGVIPITNPNDVISTYKDDSNGFYAKHFWQIPSGDNNKGNNKDYSFVVKMAEPCQILNVNIELFYEKGGSVILTQEQQNQFLQRFINQATQKDLSNQTITKDEIVGRELFSLSETSVDSSRGLKYLPLIIESFKGAQLSNKHLESTILAPNNGFFATNYPNTEFIFKHLHEKTMIINKITVRTPLESTGKPLYPIGSGLIFTSLQLSDLAPANKFYEMSYNEYKKWVKIKKQTGGVWEPYEPVGSFLYVDSNEYITIDLDFVKPCNYILLKPTSMRAVPKNYTEHFKNSQQQFTYFGAFGSVVNDSLENINNQEYEQPNGPEIECEVQIEANESNNQEPKWTVIDTLKKVKISYLSTGKYGISLPLELLNQLQDYGSSCKSSALISNKHLKEALSSYIKVTVKPQSNIWRLVGVSLQLMIPDDSILQSKNEKFNNVSLTSLRNALLDPEPTNQYVSLFTKNLTNRQFSISTRKQISSLLTHIMKQEINIRHSVYINLDLSEYVQLNILQESSSDFLEVTSFLRQLIEIDNFSHDILFVLLTLLTKLKNIKLNYTGLKGFFSLLEQFHKQDPQLTFKSIINEFQVLLPIIKEIRSPLYYILSTQYNIKSLAFEKELFADLNVVDSKVQQYNNNEETCKFKNPLKLKFIHYLGDSCDELLIDLQSRTDISEIKIAFSPSEKQTKFRLQIWTVIDSKDEQIPKKQLLHSKIYSEAVWKQLCSYSYEKMQTIYKSKNEDYECLGFSKINCTARYLLIQITYQHIPGLSLSDDIPKNRFVPEIYGKKFEEYKDEISEIDNQFKFQKISFKENIKFGHTDKFQVFITNTTKYDFPVILYDSTNEIKTKDISGQEQIYEEEGDGLPFPEGNYFEDSEVKDTNQVQDYQAYQSIEAVSEELSEFQSSLSSKLLMLRVPEIPKNKVEDIKQICQKIESLQLILLVQDTQNNKNSVNQTLLDYYYTFMLKTSQFIKRLENSKALTELKKQILCSEEGIELAIKFFEVFLLVDVGKISEEMLSLLSEVIIKQFDEQLRYRFVEQVINRFLIKPINIYTSEPSTVFSHKASIEALARIGVPIQKMVAHLLKSIEEINTENITEEQRQKTFFLISTNILLVIQSLKVKNNELKGFEDQLAKDIFKLIVWVIKNQIKFQQTDKAQIIIVCLRILGRIAKNISNQVIINILGDSSSFLRLTIHALLIGQPKLTEEFRDLLDKFRKRSEINEIQSLISIHLQTVLNCSIIYARTQSGQIQQTNDSLLKLFNNISTSAWEELVSFLFKFLLSLNSAQKSTKKEKKQQPLTKRSSQQYTGELLEEGNILSKVIAEITKSVTTSQLADIFDELKPIDTTQLKDSSPITLDMVINLIDLLNEVPSSSDTKQIYTLSKSPIAWQFVLKAICKLESSVILENNILNKIVNAFLKIDANIKQTVLSETFNLTIKMINDEDSFKESCNNILENIFLTLNYLKQNAVYDPISYDLVKGWTEILLTKSTPKRSECYDKPPLKATCRLTPQGTLTLLNELGKFLYYEVNYGGKDGILHSNELQVVKLFIAEDLITLLNICEVSDNRKAIDTLFSNVKKYQSNVQITIQQLIQWYLLNKSHPNQGLSPAVESQKNISEQVYSFFKQVSSYEEVSKYALFALIEASKEFNTTLVNLLKANQLPGYLAYTYTTRACQILEELFDLWLTNDSIASYIAYDKNCFEYLLDTLCLSSSVPNNTLETKQPIQMQQSLASITDIQQLFGDNTTDNNKQEKIEQNQQVIQPSTFSEADFREQEYATKLKIVDKPSISQFQNFPPDWTIYKKGSKTRIFFFNMVGNYYNEFSLTFQLEKEIEIRQVRIGFNAVWTDFIDKTLGIPSVVTLEGGLTQEDLRPMATLEPLNDEGYTNFSVKVFHKNFQTIQVPQKGNIEDCLNSLNCKVIKYIKFSFRRPVLTLMENYSMLSGKNYKNLVVSISFISITGQDPSKYQGLLKKVTEIQEQSSLQMLGSLCNNNYTETLVRLPQQKHLVQKIRNSFDILSNMLEAHESWIVPCFISISTENYEMGNWMLDKFLEKMGSIRHARLVGEIVLASIQDIPYRLQKFHEFIINKIKSLTSISSPTADTHAKFNSLACFLDVFCNIINFSAKDVQNYLQEMQNKEELTIDPGLLLFQLGKEDISIFLKIYKLFNNEPNAKSIARLIITYTHLPAPFTCTDPNILEYTIKLIQEEIKNGKKIYLYDLLGPIVAYSKTGIDLYFDKKLLNEALQLLCNTLTDSAYNQNTKKIKSLLATLQSVSRYPQIRELIVSEDWHLRIYHAMKYEENQNIKTQQQEQSSILRNTPQEILKEIIDFIKTIVLGNPKVEEKLAETIKEDLTQLENKNDVKFVNNYLVPLLNSESYVPLCFYPYDPSNERYITECRKLSNVASNLKTAETYSFTSKTMNTTQKSVFQNALKHFTDSTGLYRKLMNSSWELVATVTEDGQDVLPELRKMSNKGPFLVILEGTNEGKSCVVGAFSSQPMVEIPNSVDNSGKSLDIPLTDECFLFYYEDEFQFNFPITSNTKQSYFAKLHLSSTYGDGNGLSFYHNNYERIFISFSGSTTYFDISLLAIKPIESEPKIQEIPSDFVLKSAEYWLIHTPTSSQPNPKDKGANNFSLSNLIQTNEWLNQQNSLNLYRPNNIYFVPSNLTVSKMLELMIKQEIPLRLKLKSTVVKSDQQLHQLEDAVQKSGQDDGIVDFEVDIYQLIKVLEDNKSITTEQQNSDEIQVQKYIPSMNIYDKFEKIGGVEKIIDVITKSLKHWKNKERAKKWLQWIQEIQSFSCLPHFFSLLMINKNCMELLFKILGGQPDEEIDDKSQKKPEDKIKKWEEEEQRAVKFCYQIVADVFKVGDDPKLMEIALEKNILERILDRLAIVSKEPKRKWVEELPKEENNESPQKSMTALKVSDEQDDGKKKVVKKKGVGYASDNLGQNQKWNVNEYVESKKIRSEQIQSLIGIIENMFAVKKWVPPKHILKVLFSSAIFPLLESAFRSGSLLDMGKEAELYFSYLNLVKVIASHPNLVPCLLDIDEHYQPKQADSIRNLLKALKDLANIFITCLDTTSDSSTTVAKETLVNKKLAEEIISAQKRVEEAIEEYSDDIDEEEEQHIIEDALSLPLPQGYRQLLKDLRFDYMDMKTSNKYKHHYAHLLQESSNPPQSKMIRLAQELADLSTALPIDHTNSIFVRVDQARVDLMKALVMGASGTPYGHGAYEFDIYFDNSYPNAPPKCNLETTGGGAVRFNPNLYSCGKVCLSLLGTWRGNASENWDPKLSTILQVLVSIQAIIMSEDVYFNEPGFEGEAGSEEGEKKNEAYCNIVRYCNIKYAMIEQIKNPSKGFESVIRRHFYLKKNEILQECYQWIKYGSVREASYTGLINDHNHNWCAEFRQSKLKYHSMLVEVVKQLEVALNSLTPPSIRDLHTKAIKKSESPEKQKKLKSIKEGLSNLDDIDVSYDKEIVSNKILDIKDASVMDRWSRYIGAMGVDAVTKQSAASVFISGVGALGIEISKNIVLSGLKRFTLHDYKNTTFRDLAGQFFLSEDDIGKNRAQSSLPKLQQLNYYVKVDVHPSKEKLPKSLEELEKFGLKDYTVVVLTETDEETAIIVNEFCRKNGIKFIQCDSLGVFSRLFCDFGDEFTVLDKNGEEVQEILIKNITCEENGIVTLLDGSKHNLETGDQVIITGIEGMELIDENKAVAFDENKKPLKSINGSLNKVKVINRSSFEIGNTTIYAPYTRNGIAKQVKQSESIKFRSLKDCLEDNEIPLDENFAMADFEKMHIPPIIQVAFKGIDLFVKKNNREPEPWNLEDAEEFYKLCIEPAKKYDQLKEEKRLEQIIKQFGMTYLGSFPPLAAFLGGYVSQEIVKAITGKFMPTRQMLYLDNIEVLPTLPESIAEWQTHINKLDTKERKHRTDGLRICFGSELLQRIATANIFMVGAGAIGCELLKNYAMIGLGTTDNGSITLTDPDVIEVSNLNRQFLFREKHLRKSKSLTAAAAAIQMNPQLKGHVFARLDKVHEGTAHIFTDKFFESLDCVTNALDNLNARRYVDMRCVSAKTALLESGTLGPKGHVQVIIPYKTESYGTQQDPQEENEIPHCTLKMFPEETLHCVEWARDNFGKIFSQKPKALLKLTEELIIPTSSQEVKTLRNALKLLKKRPKTFQDCIEFARKKFQKYFVNDIRQLLYTYPLDAKTKEGNLFWTSPKRPPTEQQFDPKNLLHATFVTACACLRARIFGIQYPGDARTEEGQLKIAEAASKVQVEDYQPSNEKAKAISQQVTKEDKGVQDEQNEEEEQLSIADNETLVKEFQVMQDTWKTEVKDQPKELQVICVPEEFEKDNDSNFHIDFIYAMSNCRAFNYKLEPMEWITVKLKAGRIIPALATTTASIAGLQTAELVKLLRKCEVKDHRNAFLSLAVPILALSEPAQAPVIKLTEDIKVTLWDRWEITSEEGQQVPLHKIFSILEERYKLHPRDVMFGSKAIYFSSIMDMPGKEKEKEQKLSTSLKELLKLDDEEDYVDFTITFSKKDSHDILKDVPTIRIYFDKKKNKSE